MSNAGELPGCSASRRWKPVQLVCHEVHNVVGIALGANGIRIPPPSGAFMVEKNQPLFNQGLEKLNGKKWIARSLAVNELPQRLRELQSAMKAVCNQVRQGIGVQRRQADLPHGSLGFTDCRQLTHQRMSGVDLIVPISANHEQVRQMLLKEVEGRRIQPLQIVEKQG